MGLAFTVSPGKTGFIGAENHYALKSRERFKIYGVEFGGDTPASKSADLLQDSKKIGAVTYGMVSKVNNHNVGIARMPVDAAKPGTQLTVRNENGTETPAVAAKMPFYDKDKKIHTAKG